tara:strand:- start:51 stop:437 length:387 start_codon:yes stop_codon:yes gene_type:complete
MSDRSFNNSMMLFVAIPLVVCWLAFACYVIYRGVNDETGFIQDNLDFYVALIAIIGGPALLFINSILEAWKAEQAAQQNALPQRLEIELQQALARHKHNLDMSAAKQQHEQLLEDRAQQHQHRSDEDE